MKLHQRDSPLRRRWIDRRIRSWLWLEITTQMFLFTYEAFRSQRNIHIVQKLDFIFFPLALVDAPKEATSEVPSPGCSCLQFPKPFSDTRAGPKL